MFSFLLTLSSLMTLWSSPAITTNHLSEPIAEPQIQIYTKSLNWAEIATPIVQDATTKMEQAEALYDWMCQNIDYDTNHEIHNATDCYTFRRGVCQGYCDLFCQLANSVALESVVVSGITKNEKGNIDKSHSWVLCNVGERWIMVDPTWGAGSVIDGQFVRKVNDRSWFDVPPQQMILTHLPEEAKYQLLSEPISEEHFFSLYALKPFVAQYGRWGREMLREALGGPNLKFPAVFEEDRGNIIIDQAPMTKSLRVGQTYIFRIKKLVDSEVALINNREFAMEEQWSVDAEGYLNIRYMPCEGGELMLGVRTSGAGFRSVVTYEVAQPTVQDLANVEKSNPLLAAEIRRVENFNSNAVEMFGIDSRRLLAEAKSGRLKSMPTFFLQTDYQVKCIEIPLERCLKVGEVYTFILQPTYGKWTAINIGDDGNNEFYGDWVSCGPDGEICISFAPEKRGRLLISVCPDDSNKYYSVIKYEVVD